ncbi:hypothetical protein BURK2_01464 [Burkholderiales bacterium]|nr:MAG: MFS transporter [Burkholderiales bacterium]CAG0974084.1 hypothetical protein BURK2_01464 [Burkholderiales bacterium]
MRPVARAHPFRALAAPNFRLFFAGQGLSMIGTWLQQVALSWLVYRLTGSALLLGLTSFAGNIAILALGPLAGVLTDRVDKRRAVLWLQAAMTLQAATLAALTALDLIAVWHILALAACLGVLSAFDLPLRQALMVNLVEDRALLGNGIALNSLLVNSARVIGPALAGLLLALAGEAWCFALNAASFIAVIFALLAMRWTVPPPAPKGHGWWASWREGAAYAFGYAPIRVSLMLLAGLAFCIAPYTTLMPVFAKDVFGGGPHTLGSLLSAAGAGALTGTLYLASRGSTRHLDLVIARAALASALGLLLFALCPWYALALPLLFVTGGGVIVAAAATNTIVQTVVDDDKRGRVMSYYTMAFVGMAPVGSLVAGALAKAIGASWALAINALLCAGVALWFRAQLPQLRQAIRPAYERLGVIRRK